jgi:hypothetical protein
VRNVSASGSGCGVKAAGECNGLVASSRIHPQVRVKIRNAL